MRFARLWILRAFAMAALVAGTLGLGGCGDDPLPTKGGGPSLDATTVDTGKLPLDAKPGDATIDGAADSAADAEPDAEPAPDAATDGVLVDAVPDPDTTGADAQDAPDAPDAALPPDTAPDVAPVDFEVVGHTPGTGATGVAQPLVITIDFNDTVRLESVTKATVYVTSLGDTLVPGKLTVQGQQITFTANGKVQPASKVVVNVTNLVQATKGTVLQAPVAFHFYMAPLAGLGPYEKLAARYAPVVRQGIGSTSAKVDRLRSPDYDGDWDADNNAKNIDKFPPLAKVGWSVIETQSHYFITYVFYWPRRIPTDTTLAFDNDTSGAIVTVARYPEEKPVALTTWFKAKTEEQMWSWATTESGFLPAGAQPGSVYLRKVYPEATLFPKSTNPKDSYGCEGLAACTPRRYPAFLTGGSHQSCLLLDDGETLPPRCLNDAYTKSQLKWIDYWPAPLAEPATQTAANPGPVATYALQSLHEAWFPHREDMGAGGLFQDSGFTYTPPVDRPGGIKHAMGSKLRTPGTSDYGRPPWAWQWNSGSYYEMPIGAPFLDAAWAWYARMGGDSGKLLAFDSAKKTGFSLDYCLHPFLFIDKRDSALCQPGPK